MEQENIVNRITQIFVFWCSCSFLYSSTALALDTTEIVLRGNLDSRAESATAPPAPISFGELAGSAFFSHVVAVRDSSQVSRDLIFYFWRTSAVNVTVLVYVDGQFVLGGTPGLPFLVSMTTSLTFNAEGHRDYSGDMADLSLSIPWVGGATTKIGKIGVTFHPITLLPSSSAFTTVIQNSDRGHLLDFDGDLIDDLAVFRPELGIWAIRLSSSPSNVIWKQWGLFGDYPIVGDYTGDGVADLVVWRPSNGNWYICKSEKNFDCFGADGNVVYQFGLPGDRPIKADYDGDGILDLAVWRPDYGWFIYKSSKAGKVSLSQWGLPTDIPVETKPNQ